MKQTPSSKPWLFFSLTLGAAAGALALTARARRLALASRAKDLNRLAVGGLNVPAHSQFVTANNVRLHTVLAGPQDGPLAVLLHGFPECWYSWRSQIPALVEAGYRVVVPDQRGYNLSDKPAGVDNYRMEHLTADVRDLIQAFGHEKAIIIGHDWGGVVAWIFGMAYPEMVNKLIVMNAPHPAAYRRELRHNKAQQLKAWYIGFFQIPSLPEKLLGLSPMSWAKFLFRRGSVRKDAFSEEALEIMAAALAQPGAARAMLNWYRAAFQSVIRDGLETLLYSRSIEMPTLLIWGEDDVALDRSLTCDLAQRVPNLRVHYVPDCGHWVQNEACDEVNAQIRSFLQ